MIVRALDPNLDWTFGSGKNNYKSGRDAVAQLIATNLRSFLGNCFFALSDGVDWFNLMGEKNEVALNLAISARILNTEGVTGILESFVELASQTRVFTVSYKVNTSFGLVTNEFQYDLNGVG